MIEIATIWEAGKFAFGSYAWARKQLKKESAHAIPLVNTAANTRGQLVKIHRIIKRVPTVAITGRAIYEGTLDFAEAQKLADELSLKY